MAFVNNKDDEEQDPNAPIQTSAPSSVLGSGASAAQTSAAGQGAAPAAPKAEPFVGISQYIDANKPQSQKLANQVVGNIDQKAGAVDTALGSAQNSFNQAADAQVVKPDMGLFDQVQNQAEQVAGNKDRAKQFATLRDATYTGPKTLQDVNSGKDWTGIQSALATAKQAKANTQTEAGRMGLIKEVANNPRETQGSLTFDNLLLQSNPNSAAALQNAGSSINDFDKRLADANSAASTRALNIGKSDAKIRGQASDALTSGYSGLKGSLTSRAATADAQQKQHIADLQQAISKGTLTAAQMQELGLDPDTRTYGQDLSPYVNYSDDSDVYSVANQNDIARQNALLQLAGNAVNLGGPALNSANPIGKAGPGFTIDTQGLQHAQSVGQAQYDDAMARAGATGTYGLGIQDDPFTFPDSGPLSSLSLNDLIKAYENQKSTGRNDLTGDSNKSQLNNVLYPLRDKLQQQYGYNQTLAKR